MITFLIARFAAWGLPEPIRKAAAWATVAVGAAILCAALVGGFRLWLDHYGDRRVEQHEAEIEAKLDTKASGAAIDASEAARDTKAEIDAVTARGLAKASDSTDPLADAFKEW